MCLIQHSEILAEHEQFTLTVLITALLATCNISYVVCLFTAHHLLVLHGGVARLTSQSHIEIEYSYLYMYTWLYCRD